LTTWEYFDNPNDAGAPPEAGTMDDGGFGSRMVPWPATIYIHLYAQSPGTTADAGCPAYMLTVQN
jgi:hypothetical protein